MKKILLILILFISIPLFNQVHAQKVGYQGKRFLVNFDTKIDLEFEELDMFELNLIPKFFFTYSPNVEFILFKNATVGIAANYFRDSLSLTFNNQDYNDLPFTVMGAGIFYKQYLNKKNDFYQAPFGLYFNLRLDYLKYTLQFPNFSYEDFVIGGRFEFGVDYLVWDRLRLSWGISVGITTGFFEKYIYIIENQTEITGTLNAEISRRYGFQHKFGIGILLF